MLVVYTIKQSQVNTDSNLVLFLIQIGYPIPNTNSEYL